MRNILYNASYIDFFKQYYSSFVDIDYIARQYGKELSLDQYLQLDPNCSFIPDPSPLFSIRHLYSYVDPSALPGHPVLCYFMTNIHKFYSPHPLFSIEHYRSQLDSDVDIPLIFHYFAYGERNHLQPNPLFDPCYFSQQLSASGVVNNSTTLLGYYIDSSSLLDPSPYFSSKFFSITSKTNFGNHLMNYFCRDRFSRTDPNPLFFGLYYLHAYADIVEAEIDPLCHFVVYGHKEGRMPNPFCSKTILKSPDILLNYITVGND